MEWHKKTAAESQERADAATISGLNKQLADSQKTADGYSTSLNQCQTQLAEQKPAATSGTGDPNFLTVVLAVTTPPQASAAPAETSTNPVVTLGNLLRPGLGTILGKLGAGQAAPAPMNNGQHFVRWVIPGRVTPYIASEGDIAFAQYTYIDIRLGENQPTQPRVAQPVAELVQQLQQQGAH
jgi:hypothetical protein